MQELPVTLFFFSLLTKKWTVQWGIFIWKNCKQIDDVFCTSPTLNMKPSLTWAIEVNTTLMSSINLTQFNLFLPAVFSSSWAGSDTRTQAVVCILHTAPNQPTLWLWNESHTLVFHWCHQCVHSLQWALCSVAEKKNSEPFTLEESRPFTF